MGNSLCRLAVMILAQFTGLKIYTMVLMTMKVGFQTAIHVNVNVPASALEWFVIGQAQHFYCSLDAESKAKR